MKNQETWEKDEVRKFFGPEFRGFFVEVGANEPRAETSQTWHLEQSGWKGVLIEPIPELCELAQSQRPNSIVVNAACTAPEKVGEVEFKIPVVDGKQYMAHAGINPELDQAGYANYRTIKVLARTLDSILEDARAASIDLLSIDVEGTELDVLRGFNFERYRPKLILIEDKLVFLDKHRFIRRHKYRLLRRTGFNNWYVPRSSSLRPGLESRLKMFRKLYLSLPFRKLKEALKKRLRS